MSSRVPRGTRRKRPRAGSKIQRLWHDSRMRTAAPLTWTPGGSGVPPGDNSTVGGRSAIRAAMSFSWSTTGPLSFEFGTANPQGRGPRLDPSDDEWCEGCTRSGDPRLQVWARPRRHPQIIIAGGSDVWAAPPLRLDDDSV